MSHLPAAGAHRPGAGVAWRGEVSQGGVGVGVGVGPVATGSLTLDAAFCLARCVVCWRGYNRCVCGGGGGGGAGMLWW